ncbi:MAG: hypothetical protein ACOX60_06495 [Massiliimalia sp.]|jgi:hypothetical protein
MLNKLLKYEIKATARWFLPMYAGIFAFAVINRFFMFFSPHINQRNLPPLIESSLALIQGGAVMVYVLIIMATFVLTLFIMLQRFYKNLLGDEGYLMFTLPVKPVLHIWSKMIVSILWIIGSIIVTILSIFVLTVDTDFFIAMGKLMESLPEVFARLMKNFSLIHMIFYFIEIIILVLVSCAASILAFYAAIALGHTRNSHRILYSFGFYMVIDFVFSLVQGFIMLVAGITLENTLSFLKDNTIWFVHISLVGISLLCLFQAIVCFIITNHILSNKLNLE